MPYFEEKVHRSLKTISFYNEERPLVERALKEMAVNGINLVQLPTGYGKTALAVSAGLKAVADPTEFVRVIHVLPLRSIIDDAYNILLRTADRLGLRWMHEIAAAQMMSVPGAPFFNKRLVFTTIDTFMLHLIKMPPFEIKGLVCPLLFDNGSWRTYGHYEVSRGAIMESMVFIDEPQLLMEQISERTLSTLVYSLAGFGVPTILMTATVPDRLRWMIKDAAELYRRPYYEMIYGENAVDENFELEVSKKRIDTRKFEGDLLGAALSELQTGSWDKVLIIANSVKIAKQAYNVLRDFNPVLLHGRMTKADRGKAFRMFENKSWIAISTQVIEAGVNLSAQLLVTEAAPAASLVQRAGRVARFKGDNEGKIVITDYDQDALVYKRWMVDRTLEVVSKALSVNGIHWKLPKVEGGIGYAQLVEKIHKGDPERPSLKVLNQILNPFTSPQQALDLIEEDFVRESKLIPVYVADTPEEVSEDNSYPVSLNHLKSLRRYLLPIIENEGEIKFGDKLLVENLLEYPNPELYMLCKGIKGVAIPFQVYYYEAYGV
jgi:CRISPR-associated endonuclease/helicase Cas3